MRWFPEGKKGWAKAILLCVVVMPLVGYVFLAPWLALGVTRAWEGAEGGTFCMASGLFPVAIPRTGDAKQLARVLAHEATHIHQGVEHGCGSLNSVKLGWGSQRDVLRFEAEAFCSELIPHLLAGGDPWDVITTAEEVLQTSYGLDELTEGDVQAVVRGTCAGVLESVRDAPLEDTAIDRHLRGILGRRPVRGGQRAGGHPAGR